MAGGAVAVLDKTDPTGEEQKRRAHLFKPGQSGNPLGRPKGSRNKLGEALVQALCEDFEKEGVAAIIRCRTEDPTNYLKILVQIMPKELVIREAGMEDLTDDQLIDALDTLRAARAKEVGPGGA